MSLLKAPLYGSIQTDSCSKQRIREARAYYKNYRNSSDILVDIQAYKEWQGLGDEQGRAEYCARHFLSTAALSRVRQLRVRIDEIWTAPICKMHKWKCWSPHENTDGDVPRDCCRYDTFLQTFDYEPNVLLAMTTLAFRSNVAVQISPRLLGCQFAQVREEVCLTNLLELIRRHGDRIYQFHLHAFSGSEAIHLDRN